MNAEIEPTDPERDSQQTDAQAFESADGRLTVYCGNGATIQTNAVFMANAYARHINGEVMERAIFSYSYVVALDLPKQAKVISFVVPRTAEATSFIESWEVPGLAYPSFL